MKPLSLDCDTLSILSSLSTEFCNDVDPVDDDVHIGKELEINGDAKRYPSKLQKVMLLRRVSVSDHTCETMLTADESQSSSDSFADGVDSTSADFGLSDESIQAIIQEIRQTLDEAQTSSSCQSTAPSNEVREKRGQARRSMMKLHNKMKLAKSLNLANLCDRPQCSKPGNDDSPQDQTIAGLRLQKRAALKVLIRAFDAVVVERKTF